MVFNHVMLLKGYLLTIDETFDFLKFIYDFMDNSRYLYKFLKKDPAIIPEKHREYFLMNHMAEINDLLIRFDKIQIYTPPCCSGISYKQFVVGHCLKQYERIQVGCDKCINTPYCCNTCIGQTENGYYDIDVIFDNFLEVNKNNICQYCHNDKREELESCNFCNFVELEHDGMRLREIKTDERLNEWTSKRNVKYYYMLDDCISCT